MEDTQINKFLFCGQTTKVWVPSPLDSLDNHQMKEKNKPQKHGGGGGGVVIRDRFTKINSSSLVFMCK